MRKAFLVFVLASSVLTGCASKKTGSTTPAPQTTSPSASASASTGSVGSGSGFCRLSKEYNNTSDEISSAFRNIDFSNPEKAKQQLADAYRSLAPKFRSAYNQALAQAPADIKPDLRLLAAAFIRFLDALEKAGYDFTKLGENDNLSKAFQDRTILDAADHVGRYFSEKCGIPYTPIPRAS